MFTIHPLLHSCTHMHQTANHPHGIHTARMITMIQIVQTCARGPRSNQSHVMLITRGARACGRGPSTRLTAARSCLLCNYPIRHSSPGHAPIATMISHRVRAWGAAPRPNPMRNQCAPPFYNTFIQTSKIQQATFPNNALPMHPPILGLQL